MADPAGLVIAAPCSGSGKTVLTLGLLAALREAGVRVGSAKAGPDYIDPRFHEQVTGRPCLNLDHWAMRDALLRGLAGRAAAEAELLVIEGVMGLFDGAVSGGGSTASLAKALRLPVLFVVDAQAQAQSAAALVKGFAEFDEDLHLAAVIFNRVGGPRHADLLKEAMARIDVPVAGMIPRNERLAIPSRHLGLVQACENGALDVLIGEAARALSGHADLNLIRALARPLAGAGEAAASLPPLGQRIAVATDEAFAFSYAHMLQGWLKAGAEILPFSPLADEVPDAAADAVYLPGGYPELHAGRLAAANGFRHGMKAAAGRGALIYGECGGFMVLGEALTDAEGSAHEMTGLLPVTTSFAKRKLHLGYRELEHDGALPLPRRLSAHEFHYSTHEIAANGPALFSARDAAGNALTPMGLRKERVMGSYAHIIDCRDAP